MTIQTSAADIRPMTRVTDLEQIVDTLAVVGLIVLTITIASGHATSNLAILIAIGEVISLCTSYQLHGRELKDEDRRSESFFQITNTTILTLKTAGVPDDVVSGLGGLVGHGATPKQWFETLVFKTTGVARGREWMPVILHYSETLPEDLPPVEPASDEPRSRILH